jgi:hypothetical protein
MGAEKRKVVTRQTGLLGVCGVLALVSCNSFDAPPDESGEPKLVIPLDERPATRADTPPPAIAGGTLSALRAGAAVVADPDRDMVSIVDVKLRTVRHVVALERGDEPGRSVEDGLGRVHVVLRGAGAIATLDPLTGAVLERRQVCKAPRGIAYESLADMLHVACSEGALVSLAPQGGAAVRTLQLEPDLRDVVVQAGELWVTRFKSAEVLRIDASGKPSDARVRIPSTTGSLAQPAESDQFGNVAPSTKQVNLQAGTAWRATARPGGGAVIVHQQAVIDEIPITAPSQQGSAYGGSGFDCGGIVKNSVSVVGSDGTVTSYTFSGAPLPVDLAVSPGSELVAVAHAGPPDAAAQRPFFVFPDAEGGSVSPAGSASPGSSTLSMVAIGNGLSHECQFASGPFVLDPVVAVAFAPSGELLAQTRGEVAQLLVIKEPPFGEQTFIALSGASPADTGHELFHRDSGGGIACASCHPEGGEDGRTWRFAGFGERRTQALHVGLRGTAPFHWQGELASIGELMSEVFVGRMGGIRQNEPRLEALSEWIFSLEPPAALRDAADPAVARGKALFESPQVGCASCHSGSKLTNNESVAVDSNAKLKLQVPSLVGIAYRAPFMHDGCASTLAARFDPACGGDAHGDVSHLDAGGLADLVAYMESL